MTIQTRFAALAASWTARLILAALLEAFPRQLAGGELRATIGLSLLAFWVLYFTLSGRERRSGPSDRTDQSRTPTIGAAKV